MAKVESLPNSPTTCGRCGRPVSVQSVDPTGWITMVPHECIQPPTLRSITKIPCHCTLCFWSGVTGDCEPDDEGTLCCPRCALAAQPVVIEYNEHERSPDPTTEPNDGSR